MAEEVKKEEVKEVVQEDLVKLVIGADNTATSEVMGYKFKYHFPSIIEGLRIQSVAKNLRKDLEKDDDVDLKVQTIILATFEVVCGEIIKVSEKPEIMSIKDALGNSVRPMTFIEFVEGLKKVNPWNELIYPLYESFIKFSADIYLKEKQLKN